MERCTNSGPVCTSLFMLIYDREGERDEEDYHDAHPAYQDDEGATNTEYLYCWPDVPIFTY
jgi:hypothetical protein